MFLDVFLIKRDKKYIKNYFYLKYKTFQPEFAGHHQLKYNQTTCVFILSEMTSTYWPENIEIADNEIKIK